MLLFMHEHRWNVQRVKSQANLNINELSGIKFSFDELRLRVESLAYRVVYCWLMLLMCLQWFISFKPPGLYMCIYDDVT